MAKIIYGVSGQGFGHSTRSKEMLRYLVSVGHEILVFTYGQAIFFLEHDFKVVEIPGLGLSYKDNKLVYWNTVYKNTRQLFEQSRSWPKILNVFREFNPDLVITDFEPLTALLAKLQRVPLISIDNQHQLTNTQVRVPLKYQNDLIADKLIVKSMVWGADYYLITSFFETPVKRDDTFLVPPIVRQDILDLKPQKQNYILVYQNSNFDQVVQQLKRSNQKFMVFGMGSRKAEDNVEFKEYSQDEWLQYLANCKAIIGTAGLSLISEALHLAKPYLTIPIKKQIEQVVNAIYLEKMGYGMWCNKFSQEALNSFIDNLSLYDTNLRRYIRQGNKETVELLDSLIKKLT